jgi:hypothetical protein
MISFRYTAGDEEDEMDFPDEEMDIGAGGEDNEDVDSQELGE